MQWSSIPICPFRRSQLPMTSSNPARSSAAQSHREFPCPATNTGPRSVTQGNGIPMSLWRSSGESPYATNVPSPGPTTRACCKSTQPVGPAKASTVFRPSGSCLTESNQKACNATGQPKPPWRLNGASTPKNKSTAPDIDLTHPAMRGSIPRPISALRTRCGVCGGGNHGALTPRAGKHQRAEPPRPPINHSPKSTSPLTSTETPSSNPRPSDCAWISLSPDGLPGGEIRTST